MADHLRPVFSRQDKLKAIEREISYRQWVYGNKVKAGKMSPMAAQRGIQIMQAIADDYRDKNLFGEPQR